MKKEINGRCPLQFECGRKSCKFQHHERDCSYYQGNARPGAEIEDQAQAMEAEWEARMTDASVLGDQSAPAALQDVEPVIVQGDTGSLVLLPVDKVGDLAVEIADLEARIARLEGECKKAQASITEFADGIEDDHIRMIMSQVPVLTFPSAVMPLAQRTRSRAGLWSVRTAPS